MLCIHIASDALQQLDVIVAHGRHPWLFAATHWVMMRPAAKPSRHHSLVQHLRLCFDAGLRPLIHPLQPLDQPFLNG